MQRELRLHEDVARAAGAWHLITRQRATASIHIQPRIAQAAIGMLLLPLSTPLLIVAGLLSGGASAPVLSPILFELNRRSDEAVRGSAFALYSGALAGAVSLGAIGGAPIVAAFGLSAALAGGIALMLVALVLTLADPSLRTVIAGSRSPVEAA